MARGARFSLGRGDLSPDRRHFRVPAAPPRVFRGALTRVAVGRGDVREVFLGAAERGRGGEEDKRTGGEAERRRGGQEERRTVRGHGRSTGSQSDLSLPHFVTCGHRCTRANRALILLPT